MSAEVQESGGKRGKSKQKKITVRVDFTPMVDMNMLLITFFMLCTTLSKPQTMEISMPSNDKNITEEQQSKVKASQAITLLLAGGDKLYYYEGEPNYKDYTSLKETSYNADGLRSILLKKNSAAVREVNDLKKQKADLKISEEDYTKKLSEIKSGKDTPPVIIRFHIPSCFLFFILQFILESKVVGNFYIACHCVTNCCASPFLYKSFSSCTTRFTLYFPIDGCEYI